MKIIELSVIKGDLILPAKCFKGRHARLAACALARRLRRKNKQIIIQKI